MTNPLESFDVLELELAFQKRKRQFENAVAGEQSYEEVRMLFQEFQAIKDELDRRAKESQQYETSIA
jgi:DNA-binding transcriptional LysR family regulator